MHRFFGFTICFLVFSIVSCDTKKKYLTDTPTSGVINIIADETYKPLLDSEIMVFESHYPDAKINVTYKPALDAMNAIDDDSIRLIVTAMHVDTSYFASFYKRKEYLPVTSIIAKDAIAIIASNKRNGLKITIDELAKICSGKITNFSQLENGGGSGKITLVFDNAASSTVQYIQDSVLKGGDLTSNAFAQESNEEVKTYVRDHTNALGIIGVNWISDSKDEENLEFSKDIFPVEIRDGENSQYYYPPHPGYIASHLYPMRRYMNVVLKENGAGLGRGFLNFLKGDIGQRIVLKAGLVPANVLTRVVEARSEM